MVKRFWYASSWVLLGRNPCGRKIHKDGQESLRSSTRGDSLPGRCESLLCTAISSVCEMTVHCSSYPGPSSKQLSLHVLPSFLLKGCCLTTWVLSLGPKWWKGRTNFCKLASNLHTCRVVHTHKYTLNEWGREGGRQGGRKERRSVIINIFKSDRFKTLLLWRSNLSEESWGPRLSVEINTFERRSLGSWG